MTTVTCLNKGLNNANCEAGTRSHSTWLVGEPSSLPSVYTLKCHPSKKSTLSNYNLTNHEMHTFVACSLVNFENGTATPKQDEEHSHHPKHPSRRFAVKGHKRGAASCRHRTAPFPGADDHDLTSVTVGSLRPFWNFLSMDSR